MIKETVKEILGIFALVFGAVFLVTLLLSPIAAVAEYFKYRECRIYAEMNDWSHQRVVFGECFVQLNESWHTREEVARGFTSSIRIQ